MFHKIWNDTFSLQCRTQCASALAGGSAVGPRPLYPCPRGLKSVILILVRTLRDVTETPRKRERLEVLQVCMKTGKMLLITDRVTVTQEKHE